MTYKKTVQPYLEEQGRQRREAQAALRLSHGLCLSFPTSQMSLAHPWAEVRPPGENRFEQQL